MDSTDDWGDDEFDLGLSFNKKPVKAAPVITKASPVGTKPSPVVANKDLGKKLRGDDPDDFFS